MIPYLFLFLLSETRIEIMEEQKDVIFADRLGAVSTDAEEDYLAHLLCLAGTCRSTTEF